MIVRNEEPALRHCLDSVVGVVDEIVIVDTGSTDATVAIAEAEKATVLHHGFPPVDFAAARNAGLDQARGDHILVLDADERLTLESGPLVRELVADQHDIGYIVSRRNIPAEPGGKAWIDHAVRLFPGNPLFRYAGVVHETVDDSILAAGGRLLRCDLVVDHFLPPEDQARAKGLRYLELLREESSDDPDRLTFLAAEYHKLERYAEATTVAERIAELAPADFTAQFTAALYHYVYAGDPARAKVDLAVALSLRPADPGALALLAEIDGRF
jgi:glycosyltransferase involved in cell wall biosynthesis